jgi:hypothetical protein
MPKFVTYAEIWGYFGINLAFAVMEYHWMQIRTIVPELILQFVSMPLDRGMTARLQI